MKRLAVFLVFSVLLAGPHGNAAAQDSRAIPLPFVGLAIGGSRLPTAFSGCTADARSAGEIRAGLAWGPVALEGRGSLLLAGFSDCLILLPEEGRPMGTGPAVEYPFERSDAHTALELRLRYSAPTRLPLVVTGGVGRLAPQHVSYLASSVGLRSRGRIRLALDLDRTWFRVPYDVVVRETELYRGPGPVLQSTHHHDWRGGLGVRLAVEVWPR